MTVNSKNNPERQKQTPELREDEIEGLVLGVNDYKDADGIIRLLTPDDELRSVYARGIQRESSKNRRLSLPFSKIRVSYLPKYSRNMLYLSHGSSESYAHRINDSLTDQSVCFVIRDLISEDTVYQGIYSDVENMWDGFNRRDLKKGFLYACLILSYLIRKMGIEPSFEGCVLCGKTDHLVTLSKEEGGLVCSECRTEEMPLIPVERLRALRALFKAGRRNIPVLNEHFSYDLADVLFLCSWIEYHMDRTYPSIRFLETVGVMERNSR